MFTYATVCSGVEGCSLALEGMGWKPVFFSEIEPFPCAVLKCHYPEVPNLGDMSKIRYEAKDGIITNGTTHVRFNGRLDLLAGGTPCQDFSVSGNRRGGAKGSGTRSSLMWEWLRLASELNPRILLWENVVGTFSSNGGRDFYELVRAIDALGYVVAWRVLDSQYTRVDRWPMAIPQRRRRVWLVGCLGGDVSEVAKILFESNGLTGDTPPRRRTRKEVAPASQDGHRGDAPMVGDTIVSKTCSTGKDVASTLSADDSTHSGQDYKRNSVIEAFKMPSMESNVMKSPNPETGIRKLDVASTLDTTTQSPTKAQGGEMIVECFENHPNDSRVKPMGDCCQTLTQRIGTGGGNLPLVATFEHHGQDSRVKPIEDISPTLGTTASNNPLTGNNPLVVEGVDETVASGVTFDAHMGFPTIDETSQTLKNGSAPGWANGVIAMATKQISQNCETDLSPTLTASDYKEPNCIAHKIVEGVDGYNFSQTGDTSATIRGTACDFQHTNGVIVKEPLPQKADNEGLDATN